MKKYKRGSFFRITVVIVGFSILLFFLNSCSTDKKGFQNKSPANLSMMKNPVAIAMWDYSWLLRHHKYGDFEDWDLVLDGLVERGYNAIRIDCFPHLVAADNEGNIQEEYLHIRESWKPAYWGNQFTMRSKPRKSLVSFLKKCKERGIYIGLSTWFMPHGTERNLEAKNVDDFVRMWDETLSFLNDHNLLHDVIYVDLLNEYPLWHGFEWFKNELNERSDVKLFIENNPDANVPDYQFIKRKNSRYTSMQHDFLQNFIDDAIDQLKVKYPEIPFFVSLPGSANLNNVDYSHFGALDPHYWFSHHLDFNKQTGLADLHMFRNEKQAHFEDSYNNVMVYWDENNRELSDWMEERIVKASEIGKKYNIPVGNTEGWGAVFWQDHPLTGWEFIKEAADICVDLAIKHNYKFICTSNFTHPQFKGMWEDIEWHQQITSRIKKGK